MRKHLLLAGLTACLFFEASAQIDPGAIYGEVSAGRRYAQYNRTRAESGISIGLNENSTLGFSYEYSRINSLKTATPLQHVDGNRFAVSYNYFHHFKPGSKWGFYVNLSAGLTNSKSYLNSGSGFQQNGQLWNKDLNFTPGIFFQPSSRVMLFANVGGVTFNSNRYNRSSQHSNIGGELNFGLRINLGSIFKKQKK
jgi:opacity protein-like surface antigen